ncbi:MAG TPA: DUF3891 family protein [Pseudogracilibacillus sp.]|nr:DUF3891 family protein [Pseudogracilibacillus sp.]
MIVREDKKHFICIEQDHHAHVAKKLITPWLEHYLRNDSLKQSVLYAIEQHDVGWNLFDKQPLWNDKTKKPYTFIDLPLLIKTVLYTNGVNIVEQRNPYAAALCSSHYTKFLGKYELEEVQQYVKNEVLRRKAILHSFPEIDDEKFQYHLGFLQLADNMSLFICLHEAGNNDNRHRYFQKGIHIPEPVDLEKKNFIEATWKNEETLLFKNIKQVETFSITLKEKFVPKEKIEKVGLQEAHKETPYKTRQITIKCN